MQSMWRRGENSTNACKAFKTSRESLVIKKEYAGVYCLRTNIMDWEPDKLWRRYIMLTNLEVVFRSLKSAPHQTTRRVKGHLWITWLAYYLVHHIRLRLNDRCIHGSR